jgi:nitroreductase
MTDMEILDIMRNRRSIRKYLKQPVEKEKLDKIVEAGLFAPNPGGRQGTKILLLDDAEMIDKIGIVNANYENRNWDVGVSKEQPSIIDDKSIRSGFYGCQALAMVCIQRVRKDQVNQIGAAFVCAQNMTLEAYDLGVSSVIVGRAEATFSQPEMQKLLDQWGLDPAYMPIVFVCLGYIDGPYPPVKARNEGRSIYIGHSE